MKILKKYNYTAYKIPYLKSVYLCITGNDDVPESQEVVLVPFWYNVSKPVSVRLPIYYGIPKTQNDYNKLFDNFDRICKLIEQEKIIKHVEVKKDGKNTCITCEFNIKTRQLTEQLLILERKNDNLYKRKHI